MVIRKIRITTADAIHEIQFAWKGCLLFILPLPLFIATIVSLVHGDIRNSLINATSFAGFVLAAIIARHAIRRPKSACLPYKAVAAILLGISTSLTAIFTAHQPLWGSILSGVAVLTGFLLFYGYNPRRNRNDSVEFEVRSELFIVTLENAERNIEGIKKAARSIANTECRERTDSIILKAKEILVLLEDDPEGLERARKFLRISLAGAERVTRQYAETVMKKAGNDRLDFDFIRLLTSIEESFDHQFLALKENKRFAVNVQIEVLETLLKQG